MVPRRRRGSARNAWRFLGLVVIAVFVVGIIVAVVGGSKSKTAATTPTTAPTPSATATAPAPTTSPPPITATPAAVMNSASAAKAAVCGIWNTLASTLQHDASSHHNAALYTDTGNSRESVPGNPYDVANTDATYAGAPLDPDVQAVSTTITGGDGSDASFQADQDAVTKVSEDCGKAP